MTSSNRAARLTVIAAALTVAALLTGCQTGTEPEAPATLPTVEVTSTAPALSPAAPVANGPNSITSPAPGATVTGPAVTITGEGTAFEATLNYQVLVAGTEMLVSQGYTTAGANGEIAPYSIELTLDPGEYTVLVYAPDMSDGEAPGGPYLDLVQVTFTVA